MWEKTTHPEFEILDRLRGFDIEGDAAPRGFSILHIHLDAAKTMANISIYCKIKGHDPFSYSITLLCVEIITKKSQFIIINFHMPELQLD